MNVLSLENPLNGDAAAQSHLSSLKRMRWTGACALLSLAGIPMHAYAYGIPCTPTVVRVPTQNVVVGSQVIGFPLEAKVRIGNFSGSYHYPTVFDNCFAGASGQAWARSTTSAVFSWSGYGVYPTGVAGIGYAMEFADGLRPGFTKLTSNVGSSGNRFFFNDFDYGLGVRSNVYFITTAPLPAGVYKIPGKIFAITRSRDTYAKSIEGSPGATSNAYLNPFTLTVKDLTCDLSSGDTNRTVILDTIKPFTGNVAGKKAFEKTANCADASKVTFKFTGTPSATDVWRFKNTGTSTGVSLTFYDRLNGTEKTITANNDSNTRTVAVSGGKAVLPVGAAYFNTGGGTSTTGTVVSTVTVSITYN